MFSPRQIEIMDALSAIVVVDGFAGLTVADLADRLRCSRRTLYTLAASRDDLILNVVSGLFEQWENTAAAAAAVAGSGVNAVLAYLGAGLEACDAFPVFFDDVARVPDIAAVHDQHRLSRHRHIAELISVGVDNGTMRTCDVDMTAEMLDAMTERIRALRQNGPADADGARAMSVLRDLVQCWLQAPAKRSVE